MLNLKGICQPGERVTIITRTHTVICTAVPYQPVKIGPIAIPDGPVADELAPEEANLLHDLTLRTRGDGGCAIGLRVERTRERGHD